MSDVHCRTVWISDVHLGTRECAAEVLLAFLDRHHCDYLYLVGDIIDFWQLGRSPHWPQIHSDVIRKVLSKARAGTIVTLIPGNHDEYLRRFCDLQLGNIMVTAEAIHRTADGRLLLVLHGDEFDSVTRYYRALVRVGDLGYRAMVALNRWINLARRLLGFRYWSLSASLASLEHLEPGRYNWLLQYYLRAEGVTLSWVGTGRCLGTMDFTEKDYEALQSKLVEAARSMQGDGWWLGAEHPRREKTMRLRLIKEALTMLVPLPRSLESFYSEVMRRKKDDHVASHSDTVNQIFHIISSSVFLGCYVLAFWDLTTAMWAGLAALFLRQIGHAILEPPCHDKEATLLGYHTRNKTLILGAYLLIPVVNVVWSGAWTAEALRPLAATVAYQWFVWTATVVAGRVAYLLWAHGPRLALVWVVKLATDPLTDVIAYSPRFLRPA